MQCRHRKFKLTIFWIKFLHKVNNPFWNAVCKFQVGIPIDERVTAVQSLENLHTFILRQPLSCPPAYNRIEHSQTSLVHNSVHNGPNDFNFDIQTLYALIGHIKIWGKVIVICIIMFLMTSYANHQYFKSASFP